MFDSETISNLDQNSQAEVRRALAALVDYGLVAAQMEVNFARLLAGSAGQTDSDLALDIREYRRQNTALLTLKELGESFSEGVY